MTNHTGTEAQTDARPFKEKKGVPTFEVSDFRGPLDLLLALISKNKVSICDIPIFLICEQYMEYIDGMERQNMEISSSFIVMAAQLMLIKSRMLLPLPEDEEDPRQELTDLLLEYQKAKATAQALREREILYAGMFDKPPEKIEADPEYTLTHDIGLLTDAFARIYSRKLREDMLSAGKTQGIDRLLSASKPVGINEKIIHILKRLIKKETCGLSDLFSESRTKNEAVATFLAILELIKARRIGVARDASDDTEYEISLIRN